MRLFLSTTSLEGPGRSCCRVTLIPVEILDEPASYFRMAHVASLFLV
jgi:hypothetical protein